MTRRFRHLSNEQLVARINDAPDFGYDDEEEEISIRIRESNGKLKVKMDYNTLKIVTDDTK